MAYARRTGVAESRLHKLLPLIYLSPKPLDAILTGTLSPRITLGDVLEAENHLDWSAQERHLGMPA